MLPELEELLPVVEELLVLDELELLEEELVVLPPPQAPRLVQDASLPGTVVVYQFA